MDIPWVGLCIVFKELQKEEQRHRKHKFLNGRFFIFTVLTTLHISKLKYKYNFACIVI
jgi:hypothetical protein